MTTVVLAESFITVLSETPVCIRCEKPEVHASASLLK